jgi:hypothetical protein
MPNLNIPISEELLRAINMAALKSGKRQKEWVIESLGLLASWPSPLELTKWHFDNLAKIMSGEESEILGLDVKHVIVDEAADDPNFCALHNKPMKDFGTKWVCEGPPQHSEAK